MKQQNSGYQPKQAKTFTKEQLFKLITMADDSVYLAHKVMFNYNK